MVNRFSSKEYPAIKPIIISCAKEVNDYSTKLPAFTNPAHGVKLNIEDVQRMVALYQVYKKFILCKATRFDQSELLILVDQHAADERVKLEYLFKNIFKISGSVLLVDAEILPLCIEVILTRKEFDSLQEVQENFHRWGIKWRSIVNEYDGMKSQLSDVHSIYLTELPKSIISRCVSDFNVPREMIKRHIYWLEENRWAIRLQAFSSNKTWEQNLTGCPRGLIDILNSKACRSAIMFNDTLNELECQQLIRSLSNCANPFQCAHGRPTTAPIAIIQK